MSMARNTDPETSHTAAQESSTKERDRQHVLFLVGQAGSYGMTCDEYAEMAGRPRDSFSPRFAELKEDGRLALNGLKRKTKLGKMALVHVLSSDPTAKPRVEKLTRKQAIELAKRLLVLVELVSPAGDEFVVEAKQKLTLV